MGHDTRQPKKSIKFARYSASLKWQNSYIRWLVQAVGVKPNLFIEIFA